MGADRRSHLHRRAQTQRRTQCDVTHPQLRILVGGYGLPTYITRYHGVVHARRRGERLLQVQAQVCWPRLFELPQRRVSLYLALCQLPAPMAGQQGIDGCVDYASCAQLAVSLMDLWQLTRIPPPPSDGRWQSTVNGSAWQTVWRLSPPALSHQVRWDWPQGGTAPSIAYRGIGSPNQASKVPGVLPLAAH